MTNLGEKRTVRQKKMCSLLARIYKQSLAEKTEDGKGGLILLHFLFEFVKALIVICCLVFVLNIRLGRYCHQEKLLTSTHSVH